MSAGLAEKKVAEALVAILDAHASVVALTGNATGNLRPADDAGAAPRKGLTYDLGPSTEREGVGENWDVAATITAEAITRAEVRALLAVVEDALTPAAFTAAGVNAAVEAPELAGVGRADTAHAPDPKRPLEQFAGEWDCTIWITL